MNITMNLPDTVSLYAIHKNPWHLLREHYAFLYDKLGEEPSGDWLVFSFRREDRDGYFWVAVVWVREWVYVCTWEYGLALTPARKVVGRCRASYDDVLWEVFENVVRAYLSS